MYTYIQYDLKMHQYSIVKNVETIIVIYTLQIVPNAILAMPGQYVLGVDIGTTSVKVNLIDIATRKAVARQTKDTRADVPSELGAAGGNKQARNINKINFLFAFALNYFLEFILFYYYIIFLYHI
jgi:hypothetical protein